MALTRSLLLPIGLTTLVLAIDAAVSLGLVSTMVAFLHSTGRGPFPVASGYGTIFELSGEPVNLVTDQGHTANAAGGTALVLVGFGSILALWFEKKARKVSIHTPTLSSLTDVDANKTKIKFDRSSRVFYAWSVIVLLSWLLTMVALIYTFVETSKTSGQVIDVNVAKANPPPARYPDGRWTPENWYVAVLELPLASAYQRSIIRGNLTSMRAWRWNLIALFLIGFALLVLVVLELWRLSRRNRQRVSIVEVLAPPPKSQAQG